MSDTLALIAYGLLLNAGFFMTFFWGRVAYRRIKHCYKERIKSRHDKYAVLATMLTVSSIATGILFGTRAYSVLVHSIDTIPEDISGIAILTGLFTLAFAKTGFVWAVHLDRRSWVWRIYVGLSVMWTFFAVIISWSIGE